MKTFSNIFRGTFYWGTYYLNILYTLFYTIFHITLIRSDHLCNRHWYRIAVPRTTATVLKYYATFKVRKFGSLFYKINTLLQKARQIVARANILFKHIINIFFPILGVLFAVSFWCYFQKLQLLLIKKKIEIIFDALYFYLCEFKKCVSDF